MVRPLQKWSRLRKFQIFQNFKFSNAYNSTTIYTNNTTTPDPNTPHQDLALFPTHHPLKLTAIPSNRHSKTRLFLFSSIFKHLQLLNHLHTQHNNTRTKHPAPRSRTFSLTPTSQTHCNTLKSTLKNTKKTQFFPFTLKNVIKSDFKRL